MFVNKSGRSTFIGMMLFWIASSSISAGNVFAENVGPAANYRVIADSVRKAVEYEIKDKNLRSMSVGIVADQQVVWAEAFGIADPNSGERASIDTVYRVGSVSKLFTDIAMMQLVESGQLDLDAPVTDYLANFAPKNPYGDPITLRQLTSHRAGLVREPPMGNYFDDSGTSLAETVASLNDTELVHRPGSKTKYSNAGIAVVGHVLERVTGSHSRPA